MNYVHSIVEEEANNTNSIGNTEELNEKSLLTLSTDTWHINNITENIVG